MRRLTAALLLVAISGSGAAQRAPLSAGATPAERREWVDRTIVPGTYVETDLDADRAYYYDPASMKRLPDGHVVGLLRAELLHPRVVNGIAVRSVRKLAEIDCAALRYRERTVEGFAANNLAEPTPPLPVSDKWTAPATADSPDGRRLFPACADTAGFAKDRADRYATVKKTQPPQEATNADIVARTAAMVAAAGPLGAVDRPPVVWRTSDKPALVFDVAVGPRLVVMPAGEFTMGEGRGRRRVRLDHALAVGMFPITYGEYSWFVHETRRPTAAGCAVIADGRIGPKADADWYAPGFAQVGRSPATCVGYDDAIAYTQWLSRRTGHRYRLLTEAEYEFANRAGSATAFWWGDDPGEACAHVNGLDRDGGAAVKLPGANTCSDGHVYTAPLDTSKPNPFGLYDTAGNVASWTADCWTGPSVSTCRARAVRGGSWASPSAGLRVSARGMQDGNAPAAWIGFRVVREL